MPQLIFLMALLLTALPVHAQAFPDIAEGTELAIAAEDLQRRGIFRGRPDGRFDPDALVNRAEAVTVMVRAVANAENLPDLSDCFPDVLGDVWYGKPVCYAKDLEWVGGYPDGTFQPVRTVAKAEFLKILLVAYGTDTESSLIYSLGLAPDVDSTELWYFPFFAYAVSTGMTSADSEQQLNPGMALTRGEVALLLHRYLLFRETDRSQELLKLFEADMRLVFSLLDEIQVDQAWYTANRNRLRAWSALQKRPNDAIVLATEKIAESLWRLTRAHRLVRKLDFEGGLGSAQHAYDLADAADAIDESASVYTDRVRAYARSLAESIRSQE